MFIIKHNGKEQYVLGDVILGRTWGFTFTQVKHEAKKFKTKGEALDLLNRYKNADYYIEEV
jgi:hypothetical protein